MSHDIQFTLEGDTRPQRSLALVPRSHREYSSVVQAMKDLQRRSKVDDRITIPKTHAVRLTEVWPNDDKRVSDYVTRAKQLDLLSVGLGTSCMVIWDSATVHQGAVSLGAGAQIEDGAFVPPLVVPCVFPASAVDAWRSYLANEGYVVLRDILGSDMPACLRSLLNDIRRINPTADLKSLDDVQNSHLGLPRRGLCYTLGFPHGEFAWQIRQHDAVRRVWREVFQEQDLMGSVDVPPLSRSEFANRIARRKSHDQWLHWDQNPLLEPVGKQQMYQSMVYLFPDESCEVGGSSWSRIAMVVCMVPVSYGRTVESEKTLLSLCITGEASNHWPQLALANYGCNGMRMSEMKKRFPQLDEREIQESFADRFLTTTQIKESGWERLYPELNPDLTRYELQSYIDRLGGCALPANPTETELRIALSSTEYHQLGELLSLEELRRIVHPRVSDYVRFVATT